MEDRRDPVRHVRIAESLWRAAQRAVVRRGDASVSAIIRRALTQYVALDDGRTTRPKRNREANDEHGEAES